VAAIDKVLKRLKRQDATKPWAREIVENGYIAGIDIDENAVTVARLHLWQRLIEEPEALPLPSLSKIIVVGNGLDTDSWGSLKRKYDIVLGNPPFLANNLVMSREEIASKFSTAQGRFDFSTLFVEQAVNVLEENGIAGLVVPNRLFRSKSGGAARKLLTDNTQIEIVVDFGSTKPFDADAYIGCFAARRTATPAPPNAQVRVIEVKTIDANFMSAILLNAGTGVTSNSEETLRTFKSRHPRGDAPWLLLSDDEQIARLQIEGSSVRLDSVAEIFQGIRTGANDFFFVALKSDDSGPLAIVENGFGESFAIETSLLELSVYGTQVRRYESIKTSSRLIYPYRGNVAISEGELEHAYPNAWQYFQINRSILSARSSLKKSNRRYYELVWPRDEKWLRKPKLMIRDLAPETSFAADAAGEIFLVGGTAVVPNDPDILLTLLAYLNSAFVNTLVKQTTPQFRGNFQKFEPQHIQGIPVLERILEDESISSQLSTLASAILKLSEDAPQRRIYEGNIDKILRVCAEERGIDPDFE
jgi:hypothetical protein